MLGRNQRKRDAQAHTGPLDAPGITLTPPVSAHPVADSPMTSTPAEHTSAAADEPVAEKVAAPADAATPQAAQAQAAEPESAHPEAAEPEAAQPTATAAVASPTAGGSNGHAAGAPAGGDGDLRERLAELTATVERLVAANAVQPAVASGDVEVDSASRTLRFAQQTAESAIAEAREEAAAIVADAERQRSEIIRRARQQADEDYAARRDLVEQESTAWHAQRTELVGELDALAEVSAQYRTGLDRLDHSISTLAERLRAGTLAAEVTRSAEVTPTAADDPSAPDAAGPVSSSPATSAAVNPPASEAAEPVPADAAPAVVSVTNEEVVVDLTDPEDQVVVRRNPFTPPVSRVEKVAADANPFVFAVDELPDSAADLAWGRDETGSSGTATTF